MWLECAVEVPLDASDITIGWFLNCQQLTSLDSRVNIQSQVVLTDIRRITSRLKINDNDLWSMACILTADFN